MERPSIQPGQLIYAEHSDRPEWTDGGTVLDRLRQLSGSPRFWQIFHAAGVAHWVILFPPGMILWPNSVPFLMYVSLMTALMTSVAGFGSALAARKADPDDPQ